MTQLSHFGAGLPSEAQPRTRTDGWQPLPGEYRTRYEAEDAAADRGSRLQVAGQKPGEVRYVQNEKNGYWRVEVRG